MSKFMAKPVGVEGGGGGEKGLQGQGGISKIHNQVKFFFELWQQGLEVTFERQSDKPHVIQGSGAGAGLQGILVNLGNIQVRSKLGNMLHTST